MAQTVELFKIEIDVNQAAKDLAKTQTEIKDLKDEIKELSKAEGDNSIAIAEKTGELKNLQKELRVNTRALQAELTLQNEQSSTLDKLQAQNEQYRKERNALNLTTEEGINRLEELNSMIDQNNAVIKENSDAQKQNKLNVGNYTESIKEALGGTVKFGDGLKALAKNPVVLILTAIVGTVKALFDALRRTQGGADKVNKLMSVMSGIFETLQGLLAKVATGLVEAFENPKQAIENLGTLIKDNIINRLEGIVEFLPEIGKAFIKLGEGEFSEAGKIATDAFAKVTLGVEDFSDKAGDAMTELSDDIKTAADRALALNNAQIALERNIISYTKKLAELNQEAQLQQQIASDSTKTYSEQQDAAEKARIASEQAAQVELNIANEQLNVLRLQIQLKREAGFETRALQQQEADAVAAATDAETNLLLLRKQNATEIELINKELFDTNLNYLIDNFDRFKTLNEKQLADEKITFEQRKAIIKNIRDLSETAFKEQIAEFQTITDVAINGNDLVSESDTRRLLEKVRLLKLDKQEEDRLLEVLRERAAVIGDLAQLERETAVDNAEQLRAFRESETQKDLEAQRQTVFTKIDIERNRLEQEYQQEIEYAQRIGAETSGIEARYRQASDELDKASFSAKLELASGFAGNIATIFGEQTAIGKAAAIAQTTIDTYKGAQSAYAALAGIPVVGPGLGIAAAGAAVAAGVANVKKILSVDSGLPGGNVSVSGVQTGTPNAPSVNQGIVSRQTLTNDANNIDVQPTLVVDSVTNAQNTANNNNNTAAI